jgi:hypothetical protein
MPKSAPPEPWPPATLALRSSRRLRGSATPWAGIRSPGRAIFPAQTPTSAKAATAALRLVENHPEIFAKDPRQGNLRYIDGHDCDGSPGSLGGGALL